METSVLFIIIKIWLFLCSHLSSLHAPIPPPECWWSQRLKSTICSIILNYLALTVSIIPPSSMVNRNHVLIDSMGQLAFTVITADWCHTDMLQVLSTEERSSTRYLLLTKMQNSQSIWLLESLRDCIIIPLNALKCIYTQMCSSSPFKVETWTCIFEVFCNCFAFSTLTSRLRCFKVLEKLFSGWCTAFQTRQITCIQSGPHLKVDSLTWAQQCWSCFCSDLHLQV